MTQFCFYEDRADHEIGLRFAVASLQRQYPDARAVVFEPVVSAGLRRWLAQRPGIEVAPSVAAGVRGWDAKPHCLLALLDRGAQEAIWLDSDLIVTGDFLTWMRSRGDEALIVAQEPRHFPQQGTANRAAAWGFARGRELGFTVNSCVVRVTPRHRELLVAWARLLERADYRAAQKRHALDRPFHFVGDQDALGALLGSAGFAAMPVRVLRAGREVVHSGGLMMDPPAGRLARPFARPLFVHAIAAKPWIVLRKRGNERGFDWWLLRLSHEVSSYVARARQFREATGEPQAWLDHATFAGRMLRVLGLGSDWLRGLPIAAAMSVAHALGLSRRPPAVVAESPARTIDARPPDA